MKALWGYPCPPLAPPHVLKGSARVCAQLHLHTVSRAPVFTSLPFPQCAVITQESGAAFSRSLRRPFGRGTNALGPRWTIPLIAPLSTVLLLLTDVFNMCISGAEEQVVVISVHRGGGGSDREGLIS
ncbi:hypothetical protein AAFF_G00056660 [Aldrovandia affinis]|uniref:Uncharacterized protein n=1 Tax=Aldrovandia affinis TaxID=143900 RepID=A0AAD7S0H1_9TELE|nr:hypothetical protein AAFF_G00056660 [Aldrovandia affinis]